MAWLLVDTANSVFGLCQALHRTFTNKNYAESFIPLRSEHIVGPLPIASCKFKIVVDLAAAE